MDHLAKVKVQSDLSSNHITPFNLVDFAQVLFNPLSEDSDHEIITVQIFHPSIRRWDMEAARECTAGDRHAREEKYGMQCPKKHKLLMGVCDEDVK